MAASVTPTPAEGERGTQQGDLAQAPAHDVARGEGPGPEPDQVDEGDGERDAPSRPRGAGRPDGAARPAAYAPCRRGAGCRRRPTTTAPRPAPRPARTAHRPTSSKRSGFVSLGPAACTSLWTPKAKVPGGLVEVVARQGAPRHVVGADAQRRHRRDDGRGRLLVLVALDEAQPGQGHPVAVRLGDGDLGRLEDDVLGEAQLDRPRRGSEARRRRRGCSRRGRRGPRRGRRRADDQGRADGHPEAHEEPSRAHHSTGTCSRRRPAYSIVTSSPARSAPPVFW